MRPMRVRLTKPVRDMAGNPYPEGREVEILFALDGVPEVLGAGYLPLSRDEWVPVVPEEEFDRLLEGR